MSGVGSRCGKFMFMCIYVCGGAGGGLMLMYMGNSSRTNSIRCACVW